MLPVIYNHTLRSLCTPLEQAPATLPPIPLLFVPPRHHAILAPHNIEVTLDLWVLACESVDLLLREAPTETRIELAWELPWLVIRSCEMV
jgi:hypothetical protein